MSGTIPPLLQYDSWRGAQLKHSENFTFTFTFYISSLVLTDKDF